MARKQTTFQSVLSSQKITSGMQTSPQHDVGKSPSSIASLSEQSWGSCLKAEVSSEHKNTNAIFFCLLILIRELATYEQNSKDYWKQ